jgi:hypothetical protein
LRTRRALRTCRTWGKRKGGCVKRLAAINQNWTIANVDYVQIARNFRRKGACRYASVRLRTEEKIQFSEEPDLHVGMNFREDQISTRLGIPNFHRNRLSAAKRQVRDLKLERDLP